MGQINRIKDAKFFTLADALELAVGTTIDGIENLRVFKVDERKSGVSKETGKSWAYQNLHVSDRGAKAVVQVWNFPDLHSFEGSIINLESTFGKNSEVYGVMIDQYKNETRIKVSESALIDNLEDAKTSPEDQWQNVEAHAGSSRGGSNARQSRNDGQRREPERRSQPTQQPQRRQQSSRGPEDRHEKKPIFGATVGMAINNAISIIRESADTEGRKPDMNYFLSRQFSQDTYTIASDILRIAERLERGSFAPSAKDRSHQGPGRPDDQQEQPQRRQQRQTRGEPPTGEYANKDANDGPIKDDGLEDDDIPF